MNWGMGHRTECRRAGIRVPALGLLLIAALAGGCAHSKKSGQGGGATEVFPVPQPPVFLNGPMALLLTNAHGFCAHVVLEIGAAPEAEPIEGELMSQGGKLMFAPGLAKSASKRSHVAGCAFIWDVAANKGYLLNDPMQAYAPIPANRQFTNLVASSAPNGAVPEKISGHPCQSAQATVAASDGAITGFRLWRATDLNGLPVRITRASDGPPLTLTLSKFRLEAVPDDLFQPPTGFAKYDTADGLINELTARQQSLKRRPTYRTEESDLGSTPEGRAPTRPQ